MEEPVSNHVPVVRDRRQRWVHRQKETNMIKFLAFLALVASSSAALADPIKLSEGQMDAVAAGTVANILQVSNTTNSIVQQSTSIAIASCTNCTGSSGATASGPGSVAAGDGVSVSAVASSANFASITQAGFFGFQSSWRR